MKEIMKSVIRIPTEQYAYVEVEFEGTSEEIIAKYREITNMYKNNSLGLTVKEFNVVLDRYLEVANLSEEEYNRMSVDQQNVIQQLKKAFKRAEAKNDRIEAGDPRMDSFMADTDREIEHQFHDVYDAKCSTCFKSRKIKKVK